MGQSHTDRHKLNMFRYAALASALLLASVNGARVRRDDAYGAPEPDTYGAPAETYGAPADSYGVTAPEYGAAESGLDLTTIIIPLLEPPPTVTESPLPNMGQQSPVLILPPSSSLFWLFSVFSSSSQPM